MLLETQQCVAFLDTKPVSKGHALVVAKTVTASLFDLPVEVQAELWEAVRRAREILIERFRPDGFNIGVNDGMAAGQTIPHAHVHVIPRYLNDVPDPRGGIRWVIPSKVRYW
jgi:diadenosine tetraphosphate (Ap4A) HIT family hydrolase